MNGFIGRANSRVVGLEILIAVVKVFPRSRREAELVQPQLLGSMDTAELGPTGGNNRGSWLRKKKAYAYLLNISVKFPQISYADTPRIHCLPQDPQGYLMRKTRVAPAGSLRLVET